MRPVFSQSIKFSSPLYVPIHRPSESLHYMVPFKRISCCIGHAGIVPFTVQIRSGTYIWLFTGRSENWPRIGISVMEIHNGEAPECSQSRYFRGKPLLGRGNVRLSFCQHCARSDVRRFFRSMINVSRVAVSDRQALAHRVPARRCEAVDLRPGCPCCSLQSFTLVVSAVLNGIWSIMALL